jgi:hypothetical protein
VSTNKLMVGMVIGLVVGLAVAGFWPRSPLHAVATDRQDTFAMATGIVDQGIEAVFMLDFLTGELRGGVLNPTTHNFSVTYYHNVGEDLKVEVGKTPRYTMVTGEAFLRSGTNFRYAPSVVYVAEMSSGKLGAFAFPYNSALVTQPRNVAPLPMTLLDVAPLRTTAVRGQ